MLSGLTTTVLILFIAMLTNCADNATNSNNEKPISEAEWVLVPATLRVM
jgi:hypothetical protein